MPHFDIVLNDDETIKQIYKDGEPYDQHLTLELPNSIPKTYFLASAENLRSMTNESEPRERRVAGVQCFLMAMVGLEAFVNVFFHHMGSALGKANVVHAADNDGNNIETKLSHLPRKTFGVPLPDQKALNRKARELYNLRSRLVHPKLVVSSATFPGMAISGMVQNSQQLFEDREFVKEALNWCLLVVARIGLIAQPTQHWFVHYWTGLDATNESLSTHLGVSSIAGEL